MSTGTLTSQTVYRLRVISDNADVLHDIARVCRRGRNAAVEDWLLRQRGLPESEKQAGTGRPRKDGTVPAAKSESTKLYHAITSHVPELASVLAPTLAQLAWKDLSAKVDWRRRVGDEERKERRRREDVLDYEERPPFTTAEMIPVPCRYTSVEFSDRLTFTLRSPLRSVDALTVELSLRGVPAAQQRVLREITSGERKLPDSTLHYRKQKDAWYWHVPVANEVAPRGGDGSADLYAIFGRPEGRRQRDRFLSLTFPGGTWYVGDGRFLLAKSEQWKARRKEIAWRYRNGAAHGHGRKKLQAALARMRSHEQNLTLHVRNAAVSTIVRKCLSEQIGTLTVHVPSLPLRKRLWFSAVGLEWDWTEFLRRLENNAARHGIVVVEKKYKLADAQRDGVVEIKAKRETADAT